MDDGKRSSVSGEAVPRLGLTADALQVVHGSIEGELHRFTVREAARLLQLHSVQLRVDCEGGHLGFRKPLPAALAVEEVDEEEFLFGPELHPLSGSEDVLRRLGKLHPVVLSRRPPSSGVHDL